MTSLMTSLTVALLLSHASCFADGFSAQIPPPIPRAGAAGRRGEPKIFQGLRGELGTLGVMRFGVSRRLRDTWESKGLETHTARARQQTVGFEINRGFRDTRESKGIEAKTAKPRQQTVGFEIPKGLREARESKGRVGSASDSSIEEITEDSVGFKNSSGGLLLQSTGIWKTLWNLFNALRKNSEGFNSDNASSDRLTKYSMVLKTYSERFTENPLVFKTSPQGFTEDPLVLKMSSSEGFQVESTGLNISLWTLHEDLEGFRENREGFNGGITRVDNVSSEGWTEEPVGFKNTSQGLPQESKRSQKSSWNLFKRLRESRGGFNVDNASEGFREENARLKTSSSVGLPVESTGLEISSRNFHDELEGFQESREGFAGGLLRVDNSSSFGSIEDSVGIKVKPGEKSARWRRSVRESKGGRKKGGNREKNNNKNKNKNNNRKRKGTKINEAGHPPGPSPAGPAHQGPASPGTGPTGHTPAGNAPQGPIMKSKWRPVAVLEGERVVLKCQTVGGAEFAWTLNGVRLKNGRGVKISSKRGVSRLAIASATPAMNGAPVSCRAINPWGSTVVSTTLRVTSTGHLHPCEPQLQIGYCFNGGTCQRVQGAAVRGLSCMCRAGFSGQRCEQQATPTRLRRSLQPKRQPGDSMASAPILVFGLCLLILSLVWRYRPLSPHSPPPADLNPGEIPPRLLRIPTTWELPRISTQWELPRISTQWGLPWISTQAHLPRISTQSHLPRISTQSKPPRIFAPLELTQISDLSGAATDFHRGPTRACLLLTTDLQL